MNTGITIIFTIADVKLIVPNVFIDTGSEEIVTERLTKSPSVNILDLFPVKTIILLKIGKISAIPIILKTERQNEVSKMLSGDITKIIITESDSEDIISYLKKYDWLPHKNIAIKLALTAEIQNPHTNKYIKSIIVTIITCGNFLMPK